MGFFSWLTADTKKPIRNVHTGEHRKVYLLQPDAEPIEEDAYQGYGVFGGVDAYVWLARNNLPPGQARKLSEKCLRGIGISMECGHLVRFKDGRIASVFAEIDPALQSVLGLKLEHYDVRWSDPVPALGNQSVNDLLDKGEAETVSLMSLGVVKNPLKFSFKRNARYSELPASENDPDQGYF